MSTEIIPTVDPDLAAICASVSANRPVDPVIARRVQEESAKVIQAMRRTQNLAVELVRESRDE